MLTEYDKHLIKGRRLFGWSIHELAQDMHENHSYTYCKELIEQYLEEEGL